MFRFFGEDSVGRCGGGVYVVVISGRGINEEVVVLV